MTLNFKINKSQDYIIEHLVDMQKFRSVHPVIFQIDDHGDNNYLIHEKLIIGFIPFTFSYPVKVEVKENQVIYRAEVFKLIKIQMTFDVIQQNNSAVINEDIQIKSWLPVKFIMSEVFKKQHKLLFENIQAS